MKKIITIFFTVFFLTESASDAQVKKVLFEEFTNASCGPCAANNPFLKSYIDSKGDTIVAIKYHTEFPGFDPMHNFNPTQVNQRRTGYYTDVNAVPWLKGDGDMFPDIWPFTLANFDNAFNTRKVIVPPLTISVADTRLAGDTIRATVTINITQNLPAGNYKLRVMAVESVIEYAVPPGNNGERIFEHVFRRGYPDMQGRVIPTAIGNYQFVFKYKREAEWVDTSMHTVAFVQNDASNKEVINCAIGINTTTGIANTSEQVPDRFSLYQNYPNPFNPVTKINYSLPTTRYTILKVYDVLGKEVAILVNETQVAGRYSVEFNASNFAGGMYFYKIESGDFVETKRMILIK